MWRKWCNTGQVGDNLGDLILSFWFPVLKHLISSQLVISSHSIYSNLETVTLNAFALVDLQGWAFEVFSKVQ